MTILFGTFASNMVGFILYLVLAALGSIIIEHTLFDTALSAHLLGLSILTSNVIAILIARLVANANIN